MEFTNRKQVSSAFFITLLMSMAFLLCNNYVAAISPTSVSISLSPNLVNANSTLTLVATVTGSSPSGTITWTTNSTTGTFNATSTALTSSSAAVTYANTQPVNVTISAAYSGDSNNSPSSSTINVRIYPVGDFYHTGYVNFEDTVYFVIAYIQAANGHFNPACDLNHDGKIDFNDVKIYVHAYETQT